MLELKDVAVDDLNRTPVRELAGKCLRDGLEVEIHSGRITGIAKSPDRGAAGEVRSVKQITPLV